MALERERNKGRATEARVQWLQGAREEMLWAAGGTKDDRREDEGERHRLLRLLLVDGLAMLANEAELDG